ncbi:MAG: hypothetical protein ACTHY8_03200 [Microbacterium gubbeenense]|uniref:hypothetical protein n=1 Tax=Microbacterium gubbeenense TaxID=159896 RepID=UPI003F98BEE9
MRTRTFLVFAAAAGACALLSGCSTSSPGASSDGDQTARATVTPDGDNVLAAFAGISSDYDAVETGPDLAEISEAEVVGTIRSVSEGRVAAVVGTDDVLSHSIVVEIAPDQVFSGSEVQTLDSVYVELNNPGDRNASEYADALPLGAQVMAYIEPAWDGSAQTGVDQELQNPDAGRPTGEPLYVLTSPQGFAIVASSGDVVWPLLGATLEGDLKDFSPDGSALLAQR